MAAERPPQTGYPVCGNGFFESSNVIKRVEKKASDIHLREKMAAIFG
jgi:hypothetical protein